MKQEIWKDIIGYEGLYQVSNLGNVMSVSRKIKTRWKKNRKTNNFLLSKSFNHKGYYFVALCKYNKLKTYLVHRLVAQAFIPNQNNKPQVNHKDGNKLNNCVDNLEWVSNKENMQHAYRTGLITKEEIKKCWEQSTKVLKKPILQIKNNLIIKEFDSVVSATKHLGLICGNGIFDVLKGRKSEYKGFVWKYKEKGN